MALGHHRRLYDIQCGMSASLCTTQTDERRRPLHDIIALGLPILLDDMKRGMLTCPYRSTHGRMIVGVSCHIRIWAKHMVGRRLAWHAI